MRKVNYIVIHCTATPQTTTIDSIQRYWRNVLKWRNPGYHKIVEPSGKVVELLGDEGVSNGVAGYNSQSINISYIGGVDAAGKPIDNRTEAQKEALWDLVIHYKTKYPNAKVLGHRDFPKVAKACPCFDAIPEYADI